MLQTWALIAVLGQAEEVEGATKALENSMAELWRLLMAGEFIEALNTIILPACIERLLPALAIFLVGRFVARILTGTARRLMVRAKVDETLAKFLANIVSTALTVAVLLAAVQALGVETTSFAAILAAAGFAIGMALQGSLANFASGVMLILFKPFKVGEFIDAGGTAGTVEEIQLFSTIMKTGDNVRIIVPNGQITSAKISNFSANETRRIDLVIGCGYGDDLLAVKEFLQETLRSDSRILQDPEPVVAVNSLGDSSVEFVVRPWVKAEDYWKTRWDLVEAIKVGFDARGFSFPFPSRDVYMHN